MEIVIGHEFLQTGVADLRRAAEVLAVVETSASRRVETLLDGGWSGRAAASFGEAWDEWRRGAAAVQSALEDLAGLVNSVHRDLSDLDLLASSSLALLGERLGS